jgi:hypothetical protein
MSVAKIRLMHGMTTIAGDTLTAWTEGEAASVGGLRARTIGDQMWEPIDIPNPCSEFHRVASCAKLLSGLFGGSTDGSDSW